MPNILGMVNTIFQFLLFVILTYNFVFFIWILSSWLPVNRSIAILRFVDNLVNPVYHGLLRILPPLRFGIVDFSPFYMFIFLSVLEYTVNILYRVVMTLLSQYMG